VALGIELPKKSFNKNLKHMFQTKNKQTTKPTTNQPTNQPTNQQTNKQTNKQTSNDNQTVKVLLHQGEVKEECGCVFVVVFLCCCGCVLCFCGGVFVVVFLWWCVCVCVWWRGCVFVFL